MVTKRFAYRMQRVWNRDRKRVTERRRSLLKRDAVLRQVGGRLLRIPLELHANILGQHRPARHAEFPRASHRTSQTALIGGRALVPFFRAWCRTWGLTRGSAALY